MKTDITLKTELFAKIYKSFALFLFFILSGIVFNAIIHILRDYMHNF